MSGDLVAITASFDELYAALCESLEDGVQITVASLTPIVMKAMKLVEQVSKRTGEKGAAKKALVVRLIERLIDDVAGISDEVRATMRTVFAAIGPSLIDGLVEADHTQFLKDTKSFFKRVCVCCK